MCYRHQKGTRWIQSLDDGEDAVRDCSQAAIPSLVDTASPFVASHPRGGGEIQWL